MKNIKTKITLLLIVIFIPLSLSASFDKNLFNGIKNNSQVLELQEFLTSEKLYTGPINGNFYSLTQQAVKRFQERENIRPTSGYFGPITRKRANQILDNQLPQVKDNSKDIENSIILSLQKQIQELLSKIESLEKKLSENQQKAQIQTKIPSTDTITTALPNGSVVEIDSNGNIVKYIKKVTNTVSNTLPVTPDEPKFNVMITDNSIKTIPSTSEQILSSFKVSSDREMTLSRSIFKLTLSNGSGNLMDMTNLIIIDKNGTVVAGPINSNSNGLLEFTDTITFPKGSTEYILRGDIGSSFSTGQWIYTSIDKDDWNVKVAEKQEKKPLPFQAEEMGVYVSSQENQLDSNGNYTVNLNLTSLTDLTSLSVKLVNKDNGFIYEQNPTQNGKDYNVVFTNISGGNYELKLGADATTLIGIYQTFTNGIFIN